jgi:hypothetical protein
MVTLPIGHNGKKILEDCKREAQFLVLGAFT